MDNASTCTENVRALLKAAADPKVGSVVLEKGSYVLPRDSDRDGHKTFITLPYKDRHPFVFPVKFPKKLGSDSRILFFVQIYWQGNAARLAQQRNKWAFASEYMECVPVSYLVCADRDFFDKHVSDRAVSLPKKLAGVLLQEVPSSLNVQECGPGTVNKLYFSWLNSTMDLVNFKVKMEFDVEDMEQEATKQLFEVEWFRHAENNMQSILECSLQALLEVPLGDLPMSLFGKFMWATTYRKVSLDLHHHTSGSEKGLKPEDIPDLTVVLYCLDQKYIRESYCFHRAVQARRFVLKKVLSLGKKVLVTVPPAVVGWLVGFTLDSTSISVLIADALSRTAKSGTKVAVAVHPDIKKHMNDIRIFNKNGSASFSGQT